MHSTMGIARVWHLLCVLGHRLQARTAANFRLRLLLLLGASLANILLGAVLYKLAVGSEGWANALFTVYAVRSGSPWCCGT